MSITAGRTSCTYWVCVDCYETHHGVREDHGTAPDREPLCLIPDDAVVTAGIWPHNDGCANVALDGTWLGIVDCDCERITFTWSSCDGCGSRLGGSREALTVWEVES